MQKKVKYRLLFYYVAGVDPLTDEPRKWQRMATYGDILSSTEGTDGQPEGWHYDVPESEFKRLEISHPGCFFSDEEVAASEALGVQQEVFVNGEFRTAGETVPLAFNTMSEWQLEEWIKTAQPTADELVAVVEAEPVEGQEPMARKLLNAESAATGGDPREEVVELLAAVLGAGASRGPDGHEGVPGTAPTEEGEPELPSDEEDEPDESHHASKAAVALAAENQVDLSEVQGSGNGGMVTRPDVEKYLAERDETG